MNWQKQLGRESIYFVFTVVISFLFWVALAVIIEQNVIAPEYLYARERNGVMLTIGVFYFIRLNAWMINRTGTHKESVWRTGDRIVRRDATVDLRMVGEAKEQCGKIMTLVKHEWMAENRGQKAQKDGSIC